MTDFKEKTYDGTETCPKCGEPDLTREFIPGDRDPATNGEQRLELGCRTCQYKFQVRPKDYVAP